MKVRLVIKSLTLVLFLALAFASASACPSPQGGIAADRDVEGHLIFVNAARLPPAAASPFQFSRSLQPAPEIRLLIGQTARSLQVDPGLVDAVMRVESGYQPSARSPKGALGLMQLIPATAARFGVQDPFDPAENIRGGVTYLGELLKRYEGSVPLTLAAYNAGEGAVQRYGGIPPFNETQHYVRAVTALYPAPSAAPAGQNLKTAFTGAARVKPTNALPAAGKPLVSTARNGSGRGVDRSNPVSAAPIYRYVDSEGTIHFAQ
ncbi:MAG TPA: lytic transglycosylase domain-containing protein [Terriglobia bacterium]|nr:lytic transglycosylase domain-containing protein [Terriglobia bacterium]